MIVGKQQVFLKPPTLEEAQVPKELLDWISTGGLTIITGEGKFETLAALTHYAPTQYPGERTFVYGRGLVYDYPDENTRNFEVKGAPLSVDDVVKISFRFRPHTMSIEETFTSNEIERLLFAPVVSKLVLTTTVTTETQETVNRFLNNLDMNAQFSPARRAELLSSATGIVHQEIIPMLNNPEQYIALHEVLPIHDNEEVQSLIMNQDYDGIQWYQDERKASKEYLLAQAVVEERISYDDAYERVRAHREDMFKSLFEDI